MNVFIFIVQFSLLLLVNSTSRRVFWNSTQNTCLPNVCKGSKLFEIPGYNNFITVNEVRDITLYDTIKTRHCLKGKYVVFLGDSSLTETVHDVIYLLTGLAANRDTWDYYFDNVVNHDNAMKETKNFKQTYGHASANLTVDKEAGHRNMTFSLSRYNVRIRHRFNGGINLENNMDGVLGMLDPTVINEYKCLLGEHSSGCRRPNIVIMQSGYHDTFENAKFGIPRVMKMLRGAKDRGTHVFWLSTRNIFHQKEELSKINNLAKEQSSFYGIPFIDQDITATRFNQTFANQELTNELFESPNFHVGSINFMQDMDKLAFSSYLTQKLLSNIC